MDRRGTSRFAGPTRWTNVLCYRLRVFRHLANLKTTSSWVVLCTICAGCTFLNNTDYLGKEYGQTLGNDAGTCSNQPNLLFCEDFEGASAPDPQRWNPTLTGSYATVAIDRSLHHSGGQSLHAKLTLDAAGATNPVAMLYHPQNFPTHYFARFFIYSTSGDVATPEALVNFQMHDGSAGVQVALQQNWQANLPAAVAFEFWGNTNGGFQLANPLTYGHWECIQWEVDETSGQVNVSLNGGQVLNEPVPGIAAYDVLAVGVAFASTISAGTYEAWIDDVVVSTTPIGCGG